jgi:hypothetical protein
LLRHFPKRAKSEVYFVLVDILEHDRIERLDPSMQDDDVRYSVWSM